MEIGKGSDTSQRKHKPTLFEWKWGIFTEVGKRVWGWMGFFDELVLRGYCRWFFFSSLNFYTFRWPIGVVDAVDGPEFPRYMVLFVWCLFDFLGLRGGRGGGACDGDILLFFHGLLVYFHGLSTEGVLGGVLFYFFLKCMFFFEC